MHAEVLSCRFRGRPPLIPISFLLLQLVLAGRYSARSSQGALCSANDPDDLLEAQRRNRENIRDRTIRRRRNGECLAFDRPETVAGARLLPACHTQPRLPSRRHSSGCAGRASRNRENCGTEFSQHPFIRDHGRQSPSAWNEGQYGCGRCRDRAGTRTSHASAEQHGCRSSPDGR